MRRRISGDDRPFGSLRRTNKILPVLADKCVHVLERELATGVAIA